MSPRYDTMNVRGRNGTITAGFRVFLNLHTEYVLHCLIILMHHKKWIVLNVAQSLGDGSICCPATAVLGISECLPGRKLGVADIIIYRSQVVGRRPWDLCQSGIPWLIIHNSFGRVQSGNQSQVTLYNQSYYQCTANYNYMLKYILTVHEIRDITNFSML